MEIIENCFRIHGDKDKMFPIYNISNISILKGEVHFMIVDRGEEVSLWINKSIEIE